MSSERMYVGVWNTVLILGVKDWRKADDLGLTQIEPHQIGTRLVVNGGAAEAGLALLEQWRYTSLGANDKAA